MFVAIRRRRYSRDKSGGSWANAPGGTTQASRLNAVASAVSMLLLAVAKRHMIAATLRMGVVALYLSTPVMGAVGRDARGRANRSHRREGKVRLDVLSFKRTEGDMVTLRIAVVDLSTSSITAAIAPPSWRLLRCWPSRLPGILFRH
jgi:hypothetical protein